MTTIEQVTAFHVLRQNEDWPVDASEQQAALLKAITYQRAFYPVRTVLDPTEELVLGDALALLALEMATKPPALRLVPGIKSLKESGEGVGSIETTYADTLGDPYPQVAAMLAPLAPTRPIAAGYWSGRLVL